jgi:hypothetical protein
MDYYWSNLLFALGVAAIFWGLFASDLYTGRAMSKNYEFDRFEYPFTFWFHVSAHFIFATVFTAILIYGSLTDVFQDRQNSSQQHTKPTVPKHM